MFDIKLKNGRYFSNVELFDINTGKIEDINTILGNEYIGDNGELVIVKMDIYKVNDSEGDNLLESVTSNDIEYICGTYKYKAKEMK